MIESTKNPISEIINQRALKYKQTLPNQNNFTISQLAQLPPYYGEVAIQDKLGYMYLGGADCGTALRLMWNGKYEPSSIKVWSKLCKKANQIYDLGAHTGIYTISAATSCSEKTTRKSKFIHSFEPYIVNFVRLKLNSKLNNIESIASIHQFAVSNKNGEVELHIPLTANDYNSAGPTLEKIGLTTKNFTTTKIECVSIDYYIKNNEQCQYLDNNSPSSRSFDLFKIDVEGNEPAVLQGMTEKLSKHPPIILIECVNEKPTLETSKILKSQGYNFYRINESNNKLVKVDSLVVIKQQRDGGLAVLDRNHLNALCIPPQITESDLLTLLTEVQ